MSANNAFLPTTVYASNAGNWTAASERLPEDEQLMMRLQEGDEAALGLLLERYAGVVLSIGIKVLRDREEAKELVQDVFFQVYRKSHLFDPRRGSARAWLLQTGYHRAFDRREYLQVRRFYDRRSVEELSEVVRASSDVEYEARMQQGRTIICGALESLSERQRQTLMLFFFEGYTLREISQHLQESLPNVRHYYYRGLKHLKESLAVVTCRDLVTPPPSRAKIKRARWGLG